MTKRIKRNVALVALAVLVALVFLLPAVAMLTSKKAFAGDIGFLWERPDASPYATSKEEAMRGRERIFRVLGFPDAIVVRLLRATEKPGDHVLITTGDHFEAMAVGGGVIQHDVLVAFSRPIAAQRWQVFLEDRILSVYLPQDYFNWGFKLSTRGGSVITSLVSAGPV